MNSQQKTFLCFIYDNENKIKIMVTKNLEKTVVGQVEKEKKLIKIINIIECKDNKEARGLRHKLYHFFAKNIL
ncbi:MAG TPA: hypothetical protein DCW90_02685 [Lachnospiraceae bacterium]|nr:hypothetical protein [Lachnospiraceae bacterium]